MHGAVQIVSGYLKLKLDLKQSELLLNLAGGYEGLRLVSVKSITKKYIALRIVISARLWRRLV